MVRKTNTPRRRSMQDNDYDFNMPTILRYGGYHLIKVFEEYELVDSNNNVVKEWRFMPSLMELFELVKIL